MDCNHQSFKEPEARNHNKNIRLVPTKPIRNKAMLFNKNFILLLKMNFKNNKKINTAKNKNTPTGCLHQKVRLAATPDKHMNINLFFSIKIIIK